MVLGHSQDTGPELLNCYYVVCAHILEAAPRGRHGCAEEKFTAFCLPGMLPGPYMGYNKNGLVYSINTITTGGMGKGKIRTREAEKHLAQAQLVELNLLVFLFLARHFLCRALLTSTNLFDVAEILADEGAGTSDGLSVNMTFASQASFIRIYFKLFHQASSS